MKAGGTPGLFSLLAPQAPGADLFLFAESQIIRIRRTMFLPNSEWPVSDSAAPLRIKIPIMDNRQRRQHFGQCRRHKRFDFCRLDNHTDGLVEQRYFSVAGISAAEHSKPNLQQQKIICAT